MIEKELLMIPGPTPLPPRVVEVMTRPILTTEVLDLRKYLKKLLKI